MEQSYWQPKKGEAVWNSPIGSSAQQQLFTPVSRATGAQQSGVRCATGTAVRRCGLPAHQTSQTMGRSRPAQLLLHALRAIARALDAAQYLKG